jgi:hypothetical protein
MVRCGLDWNRWRALVNAALNLRFPEKLSSGLTTGGLSSGAQLRS